MTSALPATTPVDLKGRKTVAPPTEAQKCVETEPIIMWVFDTPPLLLRNIRDNILDTEKFKGAVSASKSTKALEFGTRQ